MDWVPLKRIIDGVESRKFSWRMLLLRYPVINIDTRDDHAILMGEWMGRSSRRWPLWS